MLVIYYSKAAALHKMDKYLQALESYNNALTIDPS
ncbi:MAG: tetratricopeptide repeat protein [Janthinobacterium lividum]